MPTELYVYWRASVRDADTVREQVASTQQRLQAEHPGLQARLLRRPLPDTQGEHTWMEVYAHPSAPAALAGALRGTIDAAMTQALGPRLRGPRHVEVFETA
jgi:hypothetical protein